MFSMLGIHENENNFDFCTVDVYDFNDGTIFQIIYGHDAFDDCNDLDGYVLYIYDLADVFVLPSEREPWGLAVNEAMACGTSVVVSDQVGCGTDLLDDSCGRIFPAGDRDTLAQCIMDCLKRSDKMGLAASKKIGSWSFTEDLAGLKKAIGYARLNYSGTINKN